MTFFDLNVIPSLPESSDLLVSGGDPPLILGRDPLARLWRILMADIFVLAASAKICKAIILSTL